MLKYSLRTRKWKVAAPPDEKKVESIVSEVGCPHAVASLLVSRGCDTVTAAKKFLDTRLSFNDPFLLPDAVEAVKAITQAVILRERIVIYGDYDVDGVTATSILYDYLRACSAKVSYYIPDRVSEGYGVNLAAVRRLAAKGNKLMITVDTGTTAIKEVAEAQRLGMRVVVTDHHECQISLPDCPVVNPCRPDSKYPFKGLSGVGVIFKLMFILEQVLRDASRTQAAKFIVTRYSELAAVGTVADVMPLIGENRSIVRAGLSTFEAPKNLGLRQLLVASGVAEEEGGGFVLKRKPTASLIAYTLAPRINAAGRINNACDAVEMFISDRSLRARTFADGLCRLNGERQLAELKITTEAENEIAKQCGEDDRVIVLAKEGWHHGVIGIAAARLVDKYNLPTIMISLEPEEEGKVTLGKGSARSVDGFDLARAFEVCAECLVGYGGHELAAGLTIEKSRIPEFREVINKYADAIFWENPLERRLDVDLELEPHEVNLELAELLTELEPTGAGNPQPTFLTTELVILDITPLSDGKHTKLTLRTGGLYEASQSDEIFTALWFGRPTAELGFDIGDRIDLVYTLEINEFRGSRTVRLNCKDAKRSIFAPTRDDMGRLYKKLKQLYTVERRCTVELDLLARLLGVRAVELVQMLNVLRELGLLHASLEDGDRIVCFNVPPSGGKVRLEDSKVFSELQAAKAGHIYPSTEV